MMPSMPLEYLEVEMTKSDEIYILSISLQMIENIGVSANLVGMYLYDCDVIIF